MIRVNIKIGMKEKSGIYQQIYEVVRLIPEGKVTTYGTIGRIVDCSARQVGYAMASSLPKQGIPWQRVVNHHGCISLRSHGSPDPRQRILLEEEGIDFDHKGRIDLNRFLWQEVE